MEVGSFSEKTRADAILFEWEIPQFFTLMKNKNPLTSPEFSTPACTWRLKVETKCLHEKHVLLVTITKRSTNVDTKTLFFTIGLKRFDGVVVNETTGREVFRSIFWDHTVILPNSNLSELQNCLSGVVPSDTLTIACCMATDFPSSAGGVSRSSQTSQLTGSDVLARDLQGLLLNEEASDATVRVRGEDFRVHRNILSARTPVFAAMFRHDTSEKASGIVDIEDCEPDTFRNFLLYVYTGRVDQLTPKDFALLYELADKYQVDELKETCLQCVKSGLSVQSFCHAIRLALRHDERELTRLATEFYEDHISEIVLTVEWQNFMGENHIAANELLIKALGAKKRTA